MPCDSKKQRSGELVCVCSSLKPDKMFQMIFPSQLLNPLLLLYIQSHSVFSYQLPVNGRTLEPSLKYHLPHWTGLDVMTLE